MDRRRFLQQSGTSLGGFVVSPRLGVFGAIAAGLGFSSADKKADADKELSKKNIPLIRSGEPINAAGHPFGFAVSGIASVKAPSAFENNGLGARVIFVAAHKKSEATSALPPEKRAGISTVEFVRTKDGWRHLVKSSLNRRWDATTPIPIEGARLLPDQPAHRHSALTSGVENISCATELPWPAVLCGADWVVEVNPMTGSVVKRFSLGRIFPVAMAPVCVSGKPLTLYLIGQTGVDGYRFGRLYKFVSHQQFDARRPEACAAIFMIGELFVADLKERSWKSLTAGLSAEEWTARMENIASLPDLPEPFLNPLDLKWNGSELLLLLEGEVLKLRESDDGNFALVSATGEQTAPPLQLTLPTGDVVRVERDGDNSILVLSY